MLNAYSALLTIVPESFPTDTRGLGGAVANISTSLGGIATQLITGLLLEHNNGLGIILSLYSIFLIISGVLMLLLKETRPKSKPKQEILL